MMLTQSKLDLLQQLAVKPLTVIDLISPTNISATQDLVKLGYARDYGNQHGRRVPIRLRIWGITGSGRAVLEQQSMAELTKGRQPSLPMEAKKPLEFPKRKEGFWDGSKWFQKLDGSLTPRTTRRIAPRDGMEKNDGC